MPEFFWQRHRPSSLAAQFLVVAAFLCSSLPASAQNASIGLYSDATGNTCSFSGDAPGVVTAYVVVRPDPMGITGVQFAAPVPGCFAATFLSDVTAAGALLIGDSQTGASVVLPFCASQPVNVLQISYFRTGGTAPCCAYPVVPDPSLGVLSASDCTYQTIPIAGVVSHVNADASCECHGNSAPSAPLNPFPQDGVASASVTPVMSWVAFDVDDNLVDYDLYFGTTPSPPLVASGLTQPFYLPPAPLAVGVQHYWRVVARDAEGLESSGPTWRFTTRSGNFAPFAPTDPQPQDGETGVSTAASLAWYSMDLDGDALLYDVYFGTSPNPPLVAENILQPVYSPGTLPSLTQHYWRVVASDGTAEASSPTWSFWTGGGNLPPLPPSSPLPLDGSTNASSNPTLTWDCSDPDASGPLEYDVYFGATSPPPLAAAALTTRAYSPGALTAGAQYFWRVVARDAPGSETSGPQWTFTTRAGNLPPQPPSNPHPAHNDLAPINTLLGWQATDPDGDVLTYSVYFGTDPVTPPLVASGLPNPVYDPGPLLFDTTYHWRVECFDGLATTSGPVWHFYTFSSEEMGDVDNNGVINLNDARCALNLSVGGFCGGTGANLRADVDCSASVTPRDARCIHKNVVDGSCTFCGGTNAIVSMPPAPYLTAFNTWAVGDTLVTQVYLAGVPSLQSFGFRIVADPNVYLARAVRIGATLGWEGMQSMPSLFGLPARVGAYTTGSVDATNTVALVELHFVLTAGLEGYAQILTYVDDLAGGNGLIIRVSDDGPLPVLISRFDAVQKGDAVQLAWEFSSDEPVDTYRIYRREGTNGTPALIVEGDAATTRMYIDPSVRPATTYQYELVVRTQDGEDYRSQPATVTTAEVGLSLGQNHPNPFNPRTTISFDLPGAGSTRVRLLIMDAAGRLIRTLVNEEMPGGSHEVEWNGRDERGSTVSSGVYFYILDAGKERRTRKMVLLK